MYSTEKDSKNVVVNIFFHLIVCTSFLIDGVSLPLSILYWELYTTSQCGGGRRRQVETRQSTNGNRIVLASWSCYVNFIR